MPAVRHALRLLLLVAVLGALLGVPGIGAQAGSLRPKLVPVRLIAHDVSRAIRARPRSHAHVSARRAQLAPRFVSPLARLVPRRLASTFHALAPVTVASFDGTAAPGGYAPADPNGDIGMTQYVQAVNLRLAIYSRAAPHTLLDLVTSSEFWNGLNGTCTSSPEGDPVVQYDRLADRWVVTEFAFATDGSGNPVAPFMQCVAVSKTSDATGEWYRYAFQISTSKFPDYPKLGVWPDGYYLSYNQFNLSDGTFAGAGALALERSAMLTGSSAQARYFDLQSVNPGLGGMLPSTMEATNQPAAGAPEVYLQSFDDPTNANDRLQVWAFHVDWTAPASNSTIQPVADLPVNAFSSSFSCSGSSNCITQAGTAEGLDPVAAVVDNGTTVVPQLMQPLEYFRDTGGTERLVVSQTVDAGANQAAVRWYQLANSGAGWSVLQQGTHAPDSDNRWMSSASLDNSGELAVAYSVSGSVAPSLAYAGRVPSDPNGVMSIGEQTLLAGATSQGTGNRWGDYSSLTLDPLDLCNFWFTGEYEGPTDWRTRIGTFNFSTCVPQSPTRPVLTADPAWTTPIVREGQTITRVDPTFAGATSVTYQWRRCDQYGLSCVDIPGASGASHVFSAADASGDRTVRVQATAVNATGTAVAVSTATPVVQSLPPANVNLPVISGTAQPGQTLSTSDGTWTSSSPLSFTYRWQRCSPACVFIAGATGSTYTVGSADLGSTIDVVVSATNTGGGTDAAAVATGPVATAASDGSGSGGSSGGGSGGATSGGGGGAGGAGGTLDLALTGYQTPAHPVVGMDVEYVLTVTMLTQHQLAQNVNVAVSMPAGLTYLSSRVDRGSGCRPPTSASLVCDLDFLSDQALTATIVLDAKVTSDGTHTLSATVSTQQPEASLANNTLTLTDASGGSTPPVGLNGGDGSNSADTVKPTAHALRSAGRRGKVAKLRFKVYDDHGVAKALVAVRHKKRVVATLTTGYGPVAYGSVYYVGWKVPTSAAKGSYSFCVTGLDKASNRSARSCAPLAIR